MSKSRSPDPSQLNLFTTHDEDLTQPFNLYTGLQALRNLREAWNQTAPVNARIILAVYDITVNKRRNQCIKILEEAGLMRVQKSVFVGGVKVQHFKRMKDKLEELAGQLDETDSIFLMPIQVETLDNMFVIGCRPDLEGLLGTRRVLIF